MTKTEYSGFDTWAAVLDHVKSRAPLLYQAPLDYTPVPVRVVAQRYGKLRVFPPSSDADPFTADEGHLSRFRKVTPHD